MYWANKQKEHNTYTTIITLINILSLESHSLKKKQKKGTNTPRV